MRITPVYEKKAFNLIKCFIIKAHQVQDVKKKSIPTSIFLSYWLTNRICSIVDHSTAAMKKLLLALMNQLFALTIFCTMGEVKFFRLTSRLVSKYLHLIRGCSDKIS
jgi:hypothetical protein